MSWRPIKKSNGQRIDKLLTDAEKTVWETHPATRNIYRFEQEDTPEKPKITAPPPEAKPYVPKAGLTPKDKTQHKKS